MVQNGPKGLSIEYEVWANVRWIVSLAVAVGLSLSAAPPAGAVQQVDVPNPVGTAPLVTVTIEEHCVEYHGADVDTIDDCVAAHEGTDLI